MKEFAKYQCEFCNAEYKDKAMAEECEINHKSKIKVKSKKYLPINMDKCGYPLSINIEFEDGKVITYKRG